MVPPWVRLVVIASLLAVSIPTLAWLAAQDAPDPELVGYLKGFASALAMGLIDTLGLFARSLSSSPSSSPPSSSTAPQSSPGYREPRPGPEEHTGRHRRR